LCMEHCLHLRLFLHSSIVLLHLLQLSFMTSKTNLHLYFIWPASRQTERQVWLSIGAFFSSSFSSKTTTISYSNVVASINQSRPTWLTTQETTKDQQEAAALKLNWDIFASSHLEKEI
jgi:hypothetical protein